MALLSTKEAAEKLNVSAVRVRQLIQENRLLAKRIGRDYVIDEKDLVSVRTYGKAGRPRKGD